MSYSNQVRLTWPQKDKILAGFQDGKPLWLDTMEELPSLPLSRKFSFGNPAPVPDFPNMLIKGDNLYVMSQLLQNFRGKIKCIYIDPPFNTGKTFAHYSDGLENGLWLSMMQPRLILLKELLAEDGVLFIHIDDDEMPYLKVLADEIFSEDSASGSQSGHIATIIWQKKFAPQNDAKFFSDVHDFILVYAKDKRHLTIRPLERTEKQNSRYTNRDNDPRGPWTSSDLTVKTPNPEWIYEITLPSGRTVKPAESRSWGFPPERFKELAADNRIWFGDKGDSMPRLKRFLSEVKQGVVPKTIWLRDETGDNSEGKKEIKHFIAPGHPVFTTPKPERLLQRILHIATQEGDWVLDAFLGSGTTCAAAHKMNRRWIGIESGSQIEEICLPRLKAVVEGTDPGGITRQVNWTGGGGFTYYCKEELAFSPYR